MAPSVQPFSLTVVEVTACQVIDDMDSDCLFKKKEPDSMFDQWFFPVCRSPRAHGFPATEKGLRLCAIAFKLKKFKISRRVIPKTRQPHVFWRNG